MSTNEDPRVFFPTVDAQSLAKKLHEAKSLQIKQQRQLKRLKRNVNELAVLKPPQLVIEDFRGTIVNVDVLLKEYSANSDELQELMESAGESDPTNLVGILDDIVEIEKLAKELNCISTIRVAYTESVSIDSTTRYLDDADILSTKKHFEDLDKLRVHVGKMSALESLHCTDLLKIQDTLKKREHSASKKVATADATTTVGAKKSFRTVLQASKKVRCTF